MTGRMENRVAVVTGGGNGIGRACCLRFAEEGAAVVAADLQAEPAAETARMITEAGGRATSIAVDVTSIADNDAMADLAIAEFGGLDAVVTAAGITHANYVSGDIEAEVKRMTRQFDYLERPGWDFVEQDMDEWDTVMAVNVKGTLLSMQSCVARMLDAGGGGTVVTIASIAAKHPDAGPLAYTTSKAAVWMLTKKAARMLGPMGIRVNAIGPGFIDTHMTKVIDLIPDDKRRVDFYAQIPLGRKGVPLEIANTALFLSNDESSYFSGEILHPDGGFFTE